MYKSRYVPIAVVCFAGLVWGASPALAQCGNRPLRSPRPLTPVATVEAFAGDGQSAAVNTAFVTALQARVLGPCGELLSGLTVTFTAPSSGASATFPNGASGVTNAQGIATVNASANGTPGDYQVTATTAGIPGLFSLTNTGGSPTPASITVTAGTPQSTVVNTAFGTNLTVIVKDGSNNPVSGVTVTFASPTSGPSATLAPPTSVVTGSDGTASVSATASVAAGAYSVTATVTGLTPANFSLTNLAGAPASVVQIAGAVQSAVVSTQFTVRLRVLIRDIFNNLVPGVTVTFVGPTSGASATFAPILSGAQPESKGGRRSAGTEVITASNGTAAVFATANTIAGAYSVAANVTGVTAPTFSLTNRPGPAAVVTTAGTPQSTLVNTAFGTNLTATVTDSFGNPVSGVTLNFAAPTTGASATFPDGASAITNAQGAGTVIVSANGTAGSYQVLANAAGISGIFSLTNTAPPQTAQTIAFGVLGGQSYGAAPFGLSAPATSGLTVSFASTTSSVCTASGTTVTIVGAGSCSITASQAGNGAYFAAPNVIQGFTVSQATLTVTAQNATITYPAVSPSFLANITGFVNGDLSTVVTGSPAFSTSATTTNAVPNAGSWIITPSAGTLAASNYTFSHYVNGFLTVNPAALTVTANSASKVYGAPLPMFGYAITGLVNGDTSAVIAGTPNLATTATAASATGSYPITLSGLLATGNYTFTLANGTLTISKAGTSIVLTSSPLLISAAITVLPPGAGIPTGTVQFLNGSEVLGTVALAGGTASLTVPAGAVTAVYSGDGNFTGSISSLTVNPPPASSLSLTSSASPSTLGQSVTFSASVSTNGGSSGASGSVQFLEGAKLLATVSLSGGSASFTTATLAGGWHTIVAQYGGDDAFPAALDSFAQFVNAASTLLLTAAPAASVYGQPVVLTATVGPTTAPPGFALPTGQVSFSRGGVSTLASGTASVTATTIPVGTVLIAAQYGGDSTWPSASGTASVTVTQASTATALSWTMVSGQLILVAAVTPVAPGAGAPTGIVQFVNTSNNAVVASAAVSGGNATANVSATIAGLPITAVYGGDANFKGSTSPTLPSIVNAASDLPTIFAPDEVTSLFNITGLGANTSATLPLTTSLGGVTVTITDSAGVARPAQLYGVFGSSGQINFVIPAGTAAGPATVTIALPGGATVTMVIQVGLAAPGIFTASMNGQGTYAGQVVYVRPDGSQIIASSAVINPATNQFVPNPINLSTPGQQVYLVLYGTGLRHAGSLTAAINGVNLPLFYFGAQGQYPGVDQINLQLPRILAGSGLVKLVITVDGQPANTVTVVIE